MFDTADPYGCHVGREERELFPCVYAPSCCDAEMEAREGGERGVLEVEVFVDARDGEVSEVGEAQFRADDVE